jgi:hypothetical protein
MTVMSVHIKTKLCQVVEAMMRRRDDLAFRQVRKKTMHTYSCYFDGRFGVAVGILAYYARGYVVR